MLQKILTFATENAPLLELVITLVSVLLVVPQIFLIKKQMHDAHEERRRENTITFMSTWCNSVMKDTAVAEQVARQLNTNQCKKLYDHTSFSVSDATKKDICKFCPLSRESCENCSLSQGNVVDGKILTELRWHVMTYLNTMETIMVSWQLGIVDRETIEKQFQFVNDPLKGSTLSEFRHTAGGFPAIEAFIDKIKEPGATLKNKM